jgi:protein-tyrosine sulfotransferase
MSEGPIKAPDFALIVGAARSGTTLTRLLLDAHPEIGCPSEAGFPALMAHLARVWLMVNADELGRDEAGDPGQRLDDADAPTRWEEADGDANGEAGAPRADSDAVRELPEHARRWIVGAVQSPMAEYCARGGKRVYCDKSLDSVHHLELVRALFPDVRMVLLFRHVMDTVASGIEASPWGFQAYGYAPYVQAAPGNAVAALASYWLDHVSRALSWEQEHPDLCHRVRYEDLVLAPGTTVLGIQRFLGVEEDRSVLTRAFDRHAPRGPGDYKVEHTTTVHAASLGHGKRVPVAMLPPPLLEALNKQLKALGYDTLNRGWNAAERSVDGRGQGLWAERLLEIMVAFQLSDQTPDIGVFAILAEDHRALRWVIDPNSGTIERGDGDVEAVLTGTAEDLVLMLTGEENLGVLLRSGRIRHVVADEEQASSRRLIDEPHAIARWLRRCCPDPSRDLPAMFPSPTGHSQ